MAGLRLWSERSRRTFAKCFNALFSLHLRQAVCPVFFTLIVKLPQKRRHPAVIIRPERTRIGIEVNAGEFRNGMAGGVSTRQLR